MQTITNREGILIFKINRTELNPIIYRGETGLFLTLVIQNVSAYQIALPAIALQYSGFSAVLTNKQNLQSIDLPEKLVEPQLLEKMTLLQPGDGANFHMNIAKTVFAQAGYPNSMQFSLRFQDAISAKILNYPQVNQIQTLNFLIDEQYDIFCESTT